MQKRSDIFLILLAMCRRVSAVGKMHNTALCEHIVNSQHAWGLKHRPVDFDSANAGQAKSVNACSLTTVPSRVGESECCADVDTLSQGRVASGRRSE